MKKVKYLPLKNFISYISRGITPKYTESDGICVLNQKCIRNNRISIVQARKHNIKAKNISNDKLLRKWDILVNSTGTGTLGRVAQIKQDVIATADSHITIVRPNQDVNAAFLGYALKYNQQSIEALAEGSTGQTELSKEKLEERILIPCFEYKEQAKISEILLYLDERLELNEKINQNLDWEDYFRICRRIYELEKENQNLESQAQAIFKSWFVDFEPFKNGKFVDSELGKIPEGWRVGRLENVVKINSGKRPINKRDASDIGFQIPIIGASGIMGYTSDMLLDENILVTGRVGTHGVIQKIDYPCWPSDNTLVIKTTFVNYIYQLLRLVDWHALNRGTTQPLITQADLKNMKILLPDAFQLREYENKIKYFNCLQTKNSIQSRRLSQLRDTLLPKLMSGEIDVSDVAV